VKLPDQLESLFAATGVADKTGTLQEAIRVLRRYEDAPVGDVFVSLLDSRNIAIVNDGNSLNLRYLAGQRVRILLDTEGA
jgi:hypothetical protein